jgi:hypothetical protein
MATSAHQRAGSRAPRRGPRLVTLAALAVLAVLAACSPSQPQPPALVGPPALRAFYYWRTTFRLSSPEAAALRDLHVDRLYLRMFDVQWDGAGVELVGKVTLAPGQAMPAGVEIVPVVFLREELLRKLPEERLAELAATLWREVAAHATQLGVVPRELQLDCDWTDGTQAAYFALLRELRRLTMATAARPSALRLSATIRLHQVKYRERTGVPPVDRGMLMFYNMGRFTADDDTRAIFDNDSAARYLSRVREYPLPLDVALPIWSWVLHVRDGKVIDVLQSTDPDELAGVAWLRPSDPARRAPKRGVPERYVASETGFFHGSLLREGDELKTETTGPAEVAAAAALLAPRLAPSPSGAPRALALFDLSERNVTRHGATSLERLFASLR